MATTSGVARPVRTGRTGTIPAGVAAHRMDWKNPSDDSLIAFITQHSLAHDQRHLWWVRRAKLQLAWAAGDQLLEWSNDTHSLQDSVDLQRDRISLFVNRIRPAILNWISLITARPISFRVHPATADDQDISSARVQDKLARYYWRKLVGDDVFLDALWMMFCTGCAFFRSTWDPQAGTEFDVSPNDVMPEEPEEDIGGGIADKFRKMIAKAVGDVEEDVELDDGGQYQMNTGDLACDFLDGFQIVPPYRANNIPDGGWLIVRQYEPLEDLRRIYGAKAIEGLSPMYSEPYYQYQDFEGDETWNRTEGAGTYTPVQNSDHVLTYTLWRPRRLRDKDMGSHIVISQMKMLKKDENPYDHGEIPVVMIQELPSPKKFWPTSTVQDLMGIQAEINVSRTQVAIHKAATVEPRIIAEKGCGLDDSAFTEPNEIVEVNPNCINKIKPWVPEPLPMYMQWWEQSLRKDFEDVSRNHAQSYGKSTGSVKSGRHAVALQEADMRLNSPMFRLMRESLGRMCRHWLANLKQFTTEERATTIIGDNNEVEVITWSGQTMAHAEFNVECDLGTPMDRQTTLELIDMLTARGWMNPQIAEHRERVQRWLGAGVTQEVDDSHLDRANAMMENRQLLTGKLMPVSDGDEDTVHLFQHEQEQKSARYRRAVLENETIEDIFNAHKAHHERKRLEKKLRQQVYAEEIKRDLMADAGLAPVGQPGSAAPGQPGRAGQAPPPGGAGGRPALASRPSPAGFKKSNTGNIFVPR